MTVRRLASVVTTVLLSAVATAVVPAPAEAASGYCAKGTGVTVVVDRGSLGGGTSMGCDPNGANTTGSTVVKRAGFRLTYVQEGFVCQINDVPACTPPAKAYWGLFWSNGKSGAWAYSSVGINSLKVPKGGFIGWKWQSSEAHTSPGTKPVSPASSAPAPKPSSKPSPKPGPQQSPKPATRATPSQSHAASATDGAAGSTASADGSAGTGQKTKKKSAHGATKAKPTPSARSAKAKRPARAKQRASASASPTSGAPGAGGSASSDPTVSPRTNLTAGERASESGSGPMLPLLAGGLILVLAAATARLLHAHRRG